MSWRSSAVMLAIARPPTPNTRTSVAMPGNPVALDAPPRGRGYRILGGEWRRPEKMAR